MSASDTRAIVQQFNDCINQRDIEGLASLMTEDHTFIDAAGQTDTGKARCLQAWRGFFDLFPDYQNVFTSLTSRDNLVVIQGYSTCADERLAGPALWTARIEGRQVAEWRVYEDTRENRQQLNIEAGAADAL